jgi:hypothetical protein
MLNKYFDRTVVISLPQRTERRERLTRNLEEAGLTDQLEWFEAIDGTKNQPPPEWASGNGGWGCMLSHLAVLRRAVEDEVQTLLILEDDVCFSPHTVEWLPAFMQALPADWHQIYLGGQHLLPPAPTGDPMVWVPGNLNRTHAYAVTREGAVRLLRFLTNLELYTMDPGWHIDHVLGHGHFTWRWRAYCPPWWICGQDECVSDVDPGMQLTRRWWPWFRYAARLPFIIAGSREEGASIHLMLPDDPVVPSSHRDAFPGVNGGEALLIPWLRTHAALALAHGRLPAIVSNYGSCDYLSEIWPAGIRQAGETDTESLSDYPYNGLFPHPMNRRIDFSHPLSTSIEQKQYA